MAFILAVEHEQRRYRLAMGTRSVGPERNAHWAVRTLLIAFASVPLSMKIYALAMDLEVIFPTELWLSWPSIPQRRMV